MADSIGAARLALASRVGTTTEAGFASVGRLEQARRALAAVQHALGEVGCCSQYDWKRSAIHPGTNMQAEYLHACRFIWTGICVHGLMQQCLVNTKDGMCNYGPKLKLPMAFLLLSQIIVKQVASEVHACGRRR